MNGERLALTILILVCLGLPAAALGYQHSRTSVAGMQVVDLEAHLPEEGGWTPEVLRIRAGEPVRLRLHSVDVLHSFAIGRTEIGPMDVVPGKVTELEFTIDEPGTYTFFCTRWCSTNHWRMKGTLEVVGDDGSVPVSSREPAPYLALGIDLDEGHQGRAGAQALSVPDTRPSAEEGAALGLPAPAVGLTHTPSALYETLSASYPDLSAAEIWDLIAYAWWQVRGGDQLALGEHLYQRDCAACHGADGRGDGVMARDLPEEPLDWQDPVVLLESSDAQLHGKIVRGGMGTGMPGWSDLYSDEEIWAVVAFLRAFGFARQ
jgi:mono/diheme cytochrome c family protein/plastocyanin